MLKPTDKVSFGLRGYNGVRHNNLINLPPQRFVPLFIRPIPSSTDPAECQPLGVTAPQSSTTRRLAPSSRPRFSARAWCWDLVVCYLILRPFSSPRTLPSSNEMSTNLFQDVELFRLEFGNVLIFQVAARPRDSLREFQSTL